MISQRTFVVLPPEDKFEGPPLWITAYGEEGALTLAIPGLDAVSIYERAPGTTQLQLDHTHALHTQATYNPALGRDSLHPDFHLLSHLRMPKLVFGRLRAKGPTALLQARENDLWGSEAPGRALFHHEMEPYPARSDDEQALHTVRGNRLGDFDGDGLLDAALVASRGGISQLKGRLAIWFGPLDQSLKGPPARVFKNKGSAVGTELADVDRDGALELLRPKLDISIGALIRILTLGNVKVDYELYELAGPDSSATEPFCTLTKTIDVDFSGLEGKGEPLFEVTEDLDGDGIIDAVAGNPEAGYEVYLGSLRKLGHSKQASWCADEDEGNALPEAVTAVIKAIDLDGDGRGELLIQRDAGEKTAIAILKSDP